LRYPDFHGVSGAGRGVARAITARRHNARMNPHETPSARRGIRGLRILAMVLAGLVALIGIVAGVMMLGAGQAPKVEATGLPWQIETDAAGGSRVFGLALGRSSLAEVQMRFADRVRIGLVAPTGQAPSLEAYVDNFEAGFITGKLVLSFDADPLLLREAQARAPKSEVGGDGRSRRYGLAEDDLDRLRSTRLIGLAFLPSARLDEATVVQRFGAPAERIQGASGELQLLYPGQGLAIALAPAEGELAKAKPVLQYTAPAQFEERLRAPLRATQTSAPR
jgi:hypothetical protein